MQKCARTAQGETWRQFKARAVFAACLKWRRWNGSGGRGRNARRKDQIDRCCAVCRVESFALCAPIHLRRRQVITRHKPRERRLPAGSAEPECVRARDQRSHAVNGQTARIAQTHDDHVARDRRSSGRRSCAGNGRARGRRRRAGTSAATPREPKRAKN